MSSHIQLPKRHGRGFNGQTMFFPPPGIHQKHRWARSARCPTGVSTLAAPTCYVGYGCVPFITERKSAQHHMGEQQRRGSGNEDKALAVAGSQGGGHRPRSMFKPTWQSHESPMRWKAVLASGRFLAALFVVVRFGLAAERAAFPSREKSTFTAAGRGVQRAQRVFEPRGSIIRLH